MLTICVCGKNMVSFEHLSLDPQLSDLQVHLLCSWLGVRLALCPILIV